MLEDAREAVASLLGAAPDEVVFTSGATEANNLAVLGLAGDPPGHVLANPTEHPCVVAPLEHLAARGHAVEWFGVDGDGVASVDDIVARSRPDTRFVVLMLATTKPGRSNPSRHVAGLESPYPLRRRPGRRQAADELRRTRGGDADAQRHKFGGPVGVGAAARPQGDEAPAADVRRPPAARPSGRGPKPSPLAVGLAAALRISCEGMAANAERVAAVKRRFLDRLATVPPVVVNGPADGSPYVANVSFPGCRAEVLVMKLDQLGVACSAGSACSSGSMLPSSVLRAMNVPDDVLRSAVRFSFGPDHAEADADAAADRVAAAVTALAAGCGTMRAA